MFWTFKKSFDVDVKKLGDFFQKKSGQPASDTTILYSLDRNYRLMNAPVNTMTMAYIIDNST